MIRKILLLLMATAILLCAGCNGGSDNPNYNEGVPNKTNTSATDSKNKEETKTPSTVTKPATTNKDNKETRHKKKMKITVYYPDEGGLNLVAVKRTIEIDNDSEKYKAAIEALMSTPSEDSLTNLFPKNAHLVDIDVKNGIATVNFDGNLKKHFVGGSTGEEFLIGSVVNTLTDFDEVNEVKFLIDGKEIETLSGHMDLSAPVKRMSRLNNK